MSDVNGVTRVGRMPAVDGKLLRGALKLDAVVTGANALAYVAGSALLSDVARGPGRGAPGDRRVPRALRRGRGAARDPAGDGRCRPSGP